MIRSLFFDIDGTLCSLKTHEIPESAVRAITEAKARGVKIFISTGRPIQIINNIGTIEHLVDGYITTNGAYCLSAIRRYAACLYPLPMFVRLRLMPWPKGILVLWPVTRV